MGHTNGFATGNLFLAAYLIAVGNSVAGVTKVDNWNSSIQFKDSIELRDQVEQFWNGTGEVSALKIYQEYKTLTERVKS